MHMIQSFLINFVTFNIWTDLFDGTIGPIQFQVLHNLLSNIIFKFEGNVNVVLWFILLKINITFDELLIKYENHPTKE